MIGSAHWAWANLDNEQQGRLGTWVRSDCKSSETIEPCEDNEPGNDFLVVNGSCPD